MTIDTKGIAALFGAMSACVKDNQRMLIELDSVSGDGDLGLSMDDGFSGVYGELAQSEEKDVGRMLFAAGKAFNKYASSTTGTLFSNGLIASAKALRGQTEIGTEGMATMLNCWLEGIMNLGGGKRGEKTIIDALAPAADSLKESAAAGLDLPEAMAFAAEKAKAGAEATRDMLAVHGRAAVRGQDSIGMIDPGAVLFGLLIGAMADAVKE